MKKTLLLTSLLILTLTAHAQSEKSVTLNVGSPTSLVTHNNILNVFFSREETADENYTSVKIEVENLSDENVLLLFNQRYSNSKNVKKELKRNGITPDKYFHDVIESFQGLEKLCKVPPQEKVLLTHINVENGEEKVLNFPVYIGKFKDKKRSKLILMNMEFFTVSVKADKKEDTNYPPLKSACDALLNRTVCTNTKHKPKTAQQKAQLEKEKSTLIAKIERERDNWWGSTTNHHRYQELINTLQSHTFREVDCGKHKASKPASAPVSAQPSCPYANYSSAQIKQQLDNYNTQIYNSSNRAATKSQVISKANALYSCYKNHNHGRSKSAKIDQVYQRICSY